MTWACLHVAGSVLGGWSATVAPSLQSSAGRPPSFWLARLPTVVLAVRLWPGPLAAFTGWTAVLVTSAGAARARQTWRNSRRAAWAPDRVEPSRRNLWQGVGLLRQTGWPRPRPHGWTAPAVLVAVELDATPRHGCRPRPGDGILVGGTGDLPPLGALYLGRLAGHPPRRRAIAGGFDRRRYLDGRAVIWAGRIDSLRRYDDPVARAGAWLGRHRAAQLAHLRRLLPAPEADLATAVLLGERTTRTRAVSEPLATFGLAHLLAVSGLHVGILLALCGLAVGPWLRGGTTRALAAAGVLVLFVVMTGMPGSVVRASGLALLLLGAPICGRRYDALHALGLLLWMFVVWQPNCLIDSGVRLSFGAAAGIVIASRATRNGLRRLGRRLQLPAAGLIASSAAVWFTLPESSAAFGFVHPLAPLANLVAVPCFTAAVWACSAALLLAGPCWPLAAALGGIGWLVLRLLLAGAGALAATGHAGLLGQPVFGPGRLLVWSAVTGIAIAASGTRRAGRGQPIVAIALGGLLIGTAAVLVGTTPLPPGRGGPTAVQFAVGQGDACWLRFPDGWNALIDTGPNWSGGSALATTVLPWLRRWRIVRLDAVVLSHGHSDHTGGVAALKRTLPVGRWLADAKLGATLPAGRPFAPPAEAATFLHRWREWALVLWPAPGGESDHVQENARSLAVGLTRRDTLVALWSGDLERDSERLLVPQLPPVPVTGATYWKAGHHGSATSGSAALLAALRPALVAISCGVANRYRHPGHGPYVAAGDTAAIARTDLDGSLYLLWDEQGVLHWATEAGPFGTVPRRPSS